VGGQNAVGPKGVLGNDFGTQTEAALANVESVLGEAGAGLEHIVSWSILAVEGLSLADGFAAFQKAWGRRGPARAGAHGRDRGGLASPEFRCEISAVAVTGAH